MRTNTIDLVGDGPQSAVAEGQRSLEAGDWAAAERAFRAALGEEASAEALLGLAAALWWRGEVHESVSYRERAYAEFRRRPDPERAVRIALDLCIHYRANVGNRAASDGWLSRARRLVEELDLEGSQGWLQLHEAGNMDDPAAAEELAHHTRELARRAGDLDLELHALAQIGSGLVKQGRVKQGLAYLDEAMAGSLGGEGGSFDTVVFTSCNMISSCASCAEFERALQWVRAADRFTERYGCPFLYVYCRTLYASVLIATGDWEQADAELDTARGLSRDALPPIHGLALATLAELRLAQGRLEEAERLVEGFAGRGPAAPVLAAIQLTRGEPAQAATTAGRALAEAGSDRLEGARLAELLGEAELEQGDVEAAADRGRELAELGARLGCETLRAHGERLMGHALAAQGTATAREHLELALSIFGRLGMPLQGARTRLLLAKAVREADPKLATAEADAALAAFEALGAGSDADRAASLLRELGVKAARAGPRGIGTLTKREREVLALLAEGLSNPEIAERLVVSRKTVEHHVARVLSKLGVRSRTEAAAEAVRGLGERSAHR